MWTFIVGCLILVPGVTWCWAGVFEVLVGSVNMQKHSVRSFLVVIVGSNIIDLFWFFALRFILFHALVRERSPCHPPWWRGFIFGKIVRSLSWALEAHLCASLHFIFIWLWMQSWHRHHGFGSCGRGCIGFLSRADILSMSVIVLTLWAWIRHFVVGLLIGLYATLGWYHAGSWVFRCGASLIVAKVSWYFCVTLIILIISLFRIFARSPF